MPDIDITYNAQITQSKDGCADGVRSCPFTSDLQQVNWSGLLKKEITYQILADSYFGSDDDYAVVTYTLNGIASIPGSETHTVEVPAGTYDIMGSLEYAPGWGGNTVTVSGTVTVTDSNMKVFFGFDDEITVGMNFYKWVDGEWVFQYYERGTVTGVT